MAKQKPEALAEDLPTVESLQKQAEAKADDDSWKKPPQVDDEGYEIRTQRVRNADGTYSVFRVRVGSKPRFPAKGER